MFIGHYAAAYALKGIEKKASLGLLFIATQFIDILFFPFVNLGIERLNIVPNFTPSTHFHLEFYPYTHGLLGALLWSLFFYIIYRVIFRKKQNNSSKIAWLMALAVFSHWLMDFIVHTADLPLLGDNSLKVGLGLWNYKNITFATEAGLLVLGLVYYLRKTTGSSF